jgi:hypothetical protein
MGRNLKHEIIRKPAQIAFYSLIEVLRFNAIKVCQIAVEHDLFTADQIDPLGDPFDGNNSVWTCHHGIVPELPELST